MTIRVTPGSGDAQATQLPGTGTSSQIGAFADEEELAERRAVIREAFLVLEGAKVLPFSPTILIGFSAGGGYDIYARTLARHMGRHIPGNPRLVPQNMPGAGGITR